MNIHTWSDYIIKKGLLLSCVLLTSALILSVWASAVPAVFPLLRHYAGYCRSSAALVTAAALSGGLLLEDILRKSGK